ncbi:MAG: VOC family protein, partial [Chloroflexota bacterium]
ILLTLATRANPHVGAPLPENSAAVQLAFRVAPHELQECYEELQTHNVEIVQPIQLISERVRHYWQHRTLFFKDPEGNLLELYAEVEIDD